MKIAVYGATGHVGSAVTAEALSRGHQVTALSRSGASVGAAFGASADLADTATFIEIANKHDVVVISAGPPRTGDSHEPTLQAHLGREGSRVCCWWRWFAVCRGCSPQRHRRIPWDVQA